MTAYLLIGLTLLVSLFGIYGQTWDKNEKRPTSAGVLLAIILVVLSAITIAETRTQFRNVYFKDQWRLDELHEATGEVRQWWNRWQASKECMQEYAIEVPDTGCRHRIAALRDDWGRLAQELDPICKHYTLVRLHVLETGRLEPGSTSISQYCRRLINWTETKDAVAHKSELVDNVGLQALIVEYNQCLALSDSCSTEWRISVERTRKYRSAFAKRYQNELF